jgi:hypothetical protein
MGSAVGAVMDHLINPGFRDWMARQKHFAMLAGYPAAAGVIALSSQRRPVGMLRGCQVAFDVGFHFVQIL